MSNKIDETLDRMVELLQKRKNGTITTEEEAEYRELSMADNKEHKDELQTELAEKATDAAKRRDEAHEALEKLKEDPDVQKFLTLRNERTELNKKIKDQSSFDSVKTYKDQLKLQKEQKKELTDLKKKWKDAAGEGNLPGFPEKKRGGRKNASQKPKTATKSSKSRNVNVPKKRSRPDEDEQNVNLPEPEVIKMKFADPQEEQNE